MTFSIVLFDPNENAIGIGVASKFLAVGALVPWIKEGIGAIATQALANLSYGVRGLELLEKGYKPSDVIKNLTSLDSLRERRQIGIVDYKGNSAAFTGKECISFAGHIVGNNYSVQGNILAGEEVLEAMAKEAESKGNIYERIINALDAAEKNGGDKRGRQSAAIIIKKINNNTDSNFISPLSVSKYIDIRVDDSKEPLKELRKLLDLWLATFFDEINIPLSRYEDSVRLALNSLGYNNIEDWLKANNLERNFDGTNIGKYTLSILLRSVNTTK